MRAGILGGLFLVAAVFAIPSTAMGGDVSCSDFASQAAAQRYFLSHGGPSQDPAGLDPDGDGLACESNPAPYRGLLTIKYGKTYGNFMGQLTSVSSSCIPSRTIAVYRVKDGPDRLIGTVSASNTGSYRLNYPGARGTFYARSSARGACAPDLSKQVRVIP
jgi:Excalibur calcium-binding domain